MSLPTGNPKDIEGELTRALRAFILAHETGRYEPVQIAYENAKNVFEDLHLSIGMSKPLSNNPGPDSQLGTQKQYPPMVEKVARALCRRDGPDPNEPNWEDTYWPAYADEAKDAIQAMREPTQLMLDVGDAYADDGWGGETTWRVLIDAALGK